MFGHPLHPIAVHLPIALLLGGVLIDLASVWRIAWRNAGFTHLVFGVVGAVAALVTGTRDALTVPIGGADALLQCHTYSAILATVVFGLMAAGRIYFRIRHMRSGASGDAETGVPTSRAATYFALAAFGVAMIVVTGYTGGGLVYDQGIGTIAGR